MGIAKRSERKNLGWIIQKIPSYFSEIKCFSDQTLYRKIHFTFKGKPSQTNRSIRINFLEAVKNFRKMFFTSISAPSNFFWHMFIRKHASLSKAISSSTSTWPLSSCRQWLQPWPLRLCKSFPVRNVLTSLTSLFEHSENKLCVFQSHFF